MEWLQKLIDLTSNFLDLVKKVQDMAGGRKRGQIIFWLIVIMIIALLAKTAYSNVEYVASRIGSMPILLKVIVSLLVSLSAAGMALGLIYGAAILIGIPIRIGLATPTTIRLDNTFLKLLLLLKQIHKAMPDNQDIIKLMVDMDKLYEQWNSSKITKFARWVNKRNT